MKKEVLFLFFMIVLFGLLAGCSPASKLPEGISIPPRYLYDGGYISIRSPNSDEWFVFSSSSKGIEFLKRGNSEGEIFGAQVYIFPLSKIKNSDEFLSMIQEGIEEDRNNDRFKVISSMFKYTRQRRYPCIIAHSTVEDRQATVSSNTYKVSVLIQSRSIYCRHPDRLKTGFAIIYSHRGPNLSPDFDDEAKGFIDGVQVPGYR